jgi:ABC-2 type transport system permease protein
MNSIRIMRHAFLIGIRDFQMFWTWRTWTFGWLARILTSAAIWVLMGRLTGSPQQLDYLLIGNAAVAGVGTFAIAAAVWDRWDGVYPLLVASPASLAPATIGRMAIWVGHWIGSSFATFVMLILVFGWRPPLHGLILAPFGVLLLSISTFCLSVFLGALAGAVPALRNILINLLTTAIITFCGVSVPVSFWPMPVQWIASILPCTHGVAAIRYMMAGGDASAILGELGLEVAVAALWLTLALLAIDRMAERGRRDGSIDFG